jgi:ketosteroid isomerase-like protein
MTPRELIDRAVELLVAHDMTGFAGLFAVDGAMEFPFAPPGYPPRVEGRAAITEYLRHYPDLLDIRSVTPTAIHQSTDPQVIIVEFTAAGVVVATGAPYEALYIAVVTVVDGEVRHYRDYWNPLAMKETLDRLAEAADRG